LDGISFIGTPALSASGVLLARAGGASRGASITRTSELCLTEPTREVSRGFTEIMREWRRLFAKPTDKFCQLGLYFFIKKIQDEEA